MGAYFGTQNTNCLTYIPEDVKLTLDPLNVKITGSPTVSSGVVSGFSSANYLTLPDIFTPGSNSWEYVIKIKFSSVSGTEYFFGSKNYVMPLIGRVGNRFKIWISTNGSSWNFASEKSGTYTVLVDTYYWIKMKFTGSAYILSYSTDGSTFTDDINVSGTATIKGGSAPVIGYGWTDNPLTTGTVDLTACYIKIGGTTTWKGGNGRLTLKSGSKVYIPNGWSAYTYYKATYGSWTRPNLTSNTSDTSFTISDPKLSGGTINSSNVMTWGSTAITNTADVWKSFDDSTSTYFTINKGNQTFTVFDIDFDTYMKVTGVEITGKVVSSAASSLTGSQIYALTDSDGWKLLSTKTDKDVNTHTFTGVRTKKLRICARPNTNGGSYPSRLTNIIITAQKQTATSESTSSDYEYKVGSGNRVFDEVTISKDISIATGLTTDTHERTLAVNVTNMNYNTLYTAESGTGYVGTGTAMYYNTTENLVQRYSSGVLQSYRLSLPIARIKADGSATYGSISQTFNGFGYIGSHMFRHKGIKFLAPNGFKDDESYVSTEIETTDILLKEITAVNPYTWYNLITKDTWYNNTEYYIRKTAPSVSTNAYWYNNAENKLYRWSGSKWEQRLGVIVGTTVTSNKKVQSMSIKKVQPAKRGLPVKGIYLGSQNTNCLTHIPQDINLELDPLKVTVTGAITNSNGILSAFNTGVYASTEIKETGNEDIIFKAKITTHKSYNAVFSSLSKNCVIGFNSSGKICLRLAEWHGGSTVYSVDTWVWCRFVWDGSKIYLYSLKDNGYTLNTLPALSSWTLEYSTSKTSGYFGGDTLDIGWSDVSTNYFFNGSIDITQSQIKMGGTVIWQGGTGAVTLKKGSKVYIPNGTTNQKYYKYTYANWTQPTLSANGTLGSSDYACYSSKGTYSNMDVYNAFNDNSTCYHSAQGSSPYDVIFYSKTPLKPSKINLRNRSNDSRNVYPVSSLTVYGSNDGNFYTQIGSTTNSVTSAGGSWSCSVSTDVPYKYFKFEFTSSYSYFAMDYIGIVAQAQTGSVESTADDYDYIQAAGSKMFNELVVSSDKRLSSGWNDKRLLFTTKDGNMSFEQIVHSHSGNNPPTDAYRYLLWYDTNTNFVKYSSDYGATWKLNYSLPIAQITTGSGSISSIDQVFNGMGYIGCTAFALPGIKGLMPNGYNADGTYKNIEFINNGVRLQTFTWNLGAKSLFLRTNGNFADLHYVSQTSQPVQSYTAWYNPITNTYKSSGSDANTFSDTNLLYICKFTDDDNTPARITSLTPNKVQPEKTAIDVSRIYRGATLIYGYGVNDVLFESSTPGTYSLNIKQSGNYEITIVGAGGGGGGSAGSHAWMGANGGSGAVFKGVVNLSKSMITFNVGEGGTGGNSSGANAPGGQNGTDSSINFGSGKLITAGAGRGGHGTGDYGSSNTGAGGTLTITGITTVSTSINQNGVTSSDVSILGNNTGAGGVSTSGKAGTKGQNGYVKIVAL